jgi:hypothetical protein
VLEIGNVNSSCGRCTLHERDRFGRDGGYRKNWNQLTVFDPESGQWHYVRRDVVTGEVN